MKGINLRSLTKELHPVSEEHEAKPALDIAYGKARLDFSEYHMDPVRYKTFVLEDECYKLPLRALRNFSFDELCKLVYSTNICMDGSVDRLFKTSAPYEVVRKITNSMWVWGCGDKAWNEVVETWKGIQHFMLGLGSDFHVRLDYTTGYNRFGYSKYSRTYLDGVFGLLVYYKRKHVLTIGFSVMKGRRLLIQQVQLKQKTGNRWLYQLPQNRLEFVISRFALHFPTYTLCVVDGESLVQKTIQDYESQLQRVKARREVDISTDDTITVLNNQIVRLKEDTPRLADFYAACGKYARGAKLVVNTITHYEVSA